MATQPGPTTYVGINVAAKTLAGGGGVAAGAREVPTTAAGWRQLQQDLAAAGARPAATLPVMEATGAYWQRVAAALHAAGWAVGGVSPGSARHHARARRRRAKTDRVAAAVLAAYGRDLRPAPWAPAPAEIQARQLRIRQRDDLVASQTETRNRQHALAQLPAAPLAARAPLAAVLTVLREQIAALDAAIRAQARAAATIAADLARLQAIVGVGLLTAAVVVVETRPLRAGAAPGQVVAYAELDPAPHESGTSVRGAGRISKTGNARLRQALYRAAVSAVRFTPALRLL